jgi:hypothetical protein
MHVAAEVENLYAQLHAPEIDVLSQESTPSFMASLMSGAGGAQVYATRVPYLTNRATRAFPQLSSFVRSLIRVINHSQSIKHQTLVRCRRAVHQSSVAFSSGDDSLRSCCQDHNANVIDVSACFAAKPVTFPEA